MPAPDKRSLLPGLRVLFTYPVIVALYCVVLQWAYADLISPSFSYLGYRYSTPALDVQVLVWLIASAVMFALPRKLDRPSSIVLWVLYAVTVAPAILMSPYTSYLNDRDALVMSLILGAIFAGVSLSQLGERTALRLHVSPTTLWLVLALFSGTTYILLMVTQGISVEFVSILDVYDVRADYVDEARDIGILSYLVTTQANVVNPLIAARGYIHRKWGLVAIAVVGQLLLYTTTGYKHVLFGILAWLVMALVLRVKGSQTRGSTLLIGATALVISSAVIDQLGNTNLASSLFSRRFIFTPGVFTSIYTRFFTDNQQVHLGHSILRPFVDYPYEKSPPFMVGYWMAGDFNLAANANLFADGYSNFGYVGMLGAGIVLLVYLRFLDKAAVGLPIALSAIVVVIPAVALSNASVLTSMLTHGLAFAVLLLALVPRDTEIGKDPEATGDLGGTSRPRHSLTGALRH